MKEKTRIGFLGGTFNPIHNGHLIIAEAARDYLGLAEVLLIPSGCSYMKAGLPVPEARIRLAMTQLAAAGNPFFKVSDREIRRPGHTYTADTVTELHERYPEAEIVFIVGADTLFMMEQWKEPERIFAHAVVAAAAREDSYEGTGFPRRLEDQVARLTEKYRADIRLLPVQYISISSSEIRERTAAGKSIRYLVPEAVREYILENHIYR